MVTKIRILSYHFIPNNGAFIFAYALTQLFQDAFPNADVKIIDYKSTRLALYEYLKRFKLMPGQPLFYYQRGRLWDRVQSELKLDTNFPRLTGRQGLLRYFSEHYDALVVGMDVWCVLSGSERPPFPNIYWLPNEMDLIKIAYGVSAYNSDYTLMRANIQEIGNYLNAFEVIAARDRFTFQVVKEARRNHHGLVAKLPDPTFLYEYGSDGIKTKLADLGVDFNRPLVGLLLYGDDRLSIQICEHYRAKGCQVLALSMYNAYADLNLGHLLTPFEWAGAFRYLSICFSDRFHGAVFCLKSGIPFISLEKERQLPIAQSKIYDLLSDFNLRQCYFNPSDQEFNPSQMLSFADALIRNWEEHINPGIRTTIQMFKKRHWDFIAAMKDHIGTLGSGANFSNQQVETVGDDF